MIENPDRYIDAFADAGADIITVHQEACIHLHRTIQMIKKRNLKAAAALNPATPVSTLEAILPDLDMVAPDVGEPWLRRPVLYSVNNA